MIEDGTDPAIEKVRRRVAEVWLRILSPRAEDPEIRFHLTFKSPRDTAKVMVETLYEWGYKNFEYDLDAAAQRIAAHRMRNAMKL